MRTKSLLLTAALIAAGVGVSQAQVYSVNAVGYINVVCKPGYTLIANQLINSNSTVAGLFPNVPGGTTILKWNGTTFDINQYDAGFEEWNDPNQVLLPGQAAFFFNPTPANVTVTFVGDVPQGNLTNAIPPLYSMKSSIVPQAGLLQTQLGYVPSHNDIVLQFVNTGTPATSTYKFSTYDEGFGEWDAEPSLAVGEGFFILRNAAGTAQWTRQFSVN
jgi:hypothetical protein